MPRFESDSDARRLGDALARLRRERGLSQAEAGERVGMTSQGWGLYEAGKRPGLFRPDVQRRLTAALDADLRDLTLLSAGVDAAEPVLRGVESAGRAFLSPPPRGGEARHLQLSNDDLSPWAASGVVLAYEPGRWPRRGQGCVIEMADGSLVARLYEQADADAVVVRRNPAGPEERLSKLNILSVAAVTARLEN